MPRFAANLTLLFTEHDFLGRFEAAARAGFDAVECQLPYGFDKNVIADRLAASTLEMVLHNIPVGDWAAGERGIACLSDRIGEFQDGVELAINYAKTLGCKQLNCLAGVPDAETDEDVTRQTLIENLRFAANELNKENIHLLTEPVNTIDNPGFYLHSTRHALDIIQQVESDNLYLQYDIYHMQIMEGDLARTIENNLDKIKHIQLGDSPGRHEPGTGEINFDFILRHLDRIGYDGWIGCEYFPLNDTYAGLSWTDKLTDGAPQGLEE